MSQAVTIQERLKEIAAEMQSINESTEPLTEEQDTAYLALEAEADDLTVKLEALRTEAVVAERRAKADAIRANAKASSRTTTPNTTGTRIGRIHENIQDDPKRGFKSLAHFATKVFDSGQNPRGDEMLMQVAAGSGMNQSVNAEGAVLIPPAFSKTIWDKVLVKSNSLLGYCDVIPVDAGVESVTVPAIAESSRADGSRMGGIRGYWKSELALMTSSQPKFREVKLAPHELYVFAYVSDKLLRNAPATASRILEQGSADEIAFKIGNAIISGDGLGKPKGINPHPATISIAKETGQGAATIQIENIRKMYARMHTNWLSGAVWFCNQDVLTALDSLTFPVGTGGVPVFLPPGGLSDSPYARLYGKPIVPIEYCETLGTVGDLIFANLNAYAVGLKGLADAQYSMHLKFDYAQTAYRVIFEVDGQPWLDLPVTPFKGTNTTSPFLTLATRA